MIALARACGAFAGRLASVAAAGSRAPTAASVAPAAAAWGAGQTRGVIYVPVKHSVNQAMRTLTRRLDEDGITKIWRRKVRFIKPKVARKEAAKEAEKRHTREAFNAKLRWVLEQRKLGL